MSLYDIFIGMTAPVFTPFNEDESINYDIIPKYAEFLKKNGVNGIYLGGTTGEGVSLTTEERESLTQAWMIEAKKHDLFVLVVVAGLCLKDVKRLANHAEMHGAHGIAVLPSLFFKPSSVDDIVDYCKEVADVAPKTQLFYYHIPFMTGVTVSMEMFLSRGKVQIPTLRGIKFTDEDVSGVGLKCLQLTYPDNSGQNFTIFSGLDQKTHEAHLLGFRSFINCCFNFIPAVASGIFKADNVMKDAAKRQEHVNNILGIIYAFTNGFSITSIKAAMYILTGLDVGSPRKPLKTLTADKKADMKIKLHEYMKLNNIAQN